MKGTLKHLKYDFAFTDLYYYISIQRGLERWGIL